MYFNCEMNNAQSTYTNVVEAMEPPATVNVAIVIERVIQDAHTSIIVQGILINCIWGGLRFCTGAKQRSKNVGRVHARGSAMAPSSEARISD